MTVTGEENGKRAAGAGGHQLEPSRKGRSAWAPVASTRARLLPLWRQARELFAGSPTLKRLLLDAGLITGGGLMFAALIVIIRNDGGLGYDTPSYWLAGRHVTDGAPLYTTGPVHDASALHVPADLRPAIRAAGPAARAARRLALARDQRPLPALPVGSWPATVVCFAIHPGAHRAVHQQRHPATRRRPPLRDARQARRVPAALGGDGQVRARSDRAVPVVPQARVPAARWLSGRWSSWRRAWFRSPWRRGTGRTTWTCSASRT